MIDTSIIRSNLLDIKLDNILNNDIMVVDDSDIKETFFFLKSNRKVINFINDNGGILTGSRAIKSYKISGNPILNRDCDDCDFLIDRDLAMRLSDKFDLDWNLKDSVINIRSQMIDFSDHYGPMRFGIQDVQLIIKDNLPEYTVGKNFKIAKLDDILYSKLEFIKSKVGVDVKPSSYRKHLEDLNQIIIKININR